MTDSDVYAVVAYILGEANIIEKSFVMNAETLAPVEMPDRDGFVPDPRSDATDYR